MAIKVLTVDIISQMCACYGGVHHKGFILNQTEALVLFELVHIHFQEEPDI